MFWSSEKKTALKDANANFKTTQNATDALASDVTFMLE